MGWTVVDKKFLSSISLGTDVVDMSNMFIKDY